MSIKTRTQNPPFYQNYRDYKPFLRVEFSNRCAYCGIHEAEDGGSKKFGIDHYKPKSISLADQCNYSNLFYCCADCNRFKGSYWPDPLEKYMEAFILNPCDHDYDNHYDSTNPLWIAKSKTADWNIERLRLNSRKQLDIRTARIRFFEILDKLYKTKEQLEEFLKSLKPNDLNINEIEAMLHRIDEEIYIYEHKTIISSD